MNETNGRKFHQIVRKVFQNLSKWNTRIKLSEKYWDYSADFYNNSKVLNFLLNCIKDFIKCGLYMALWKFIILKRITKNYLLIIAFTYIFHANISLNDFSISKSWFLRNNFIHMFVPKNLRLKKIYKQNYCSANFLNVLILVQSEIIFCPLVDAQ